MQSLPINNRPHPAPLPPVQRAQRVSPASHGETRDRIIAAAMRGLIYGKEFLTLLVCVGFVASIGACALAYAERERVQVEAPRFVSEVRR